MSKYAALFIASTDTVVGIGAPVSVHNLKLINALKGSQTTKMLVILVASIDMARVHFANQGFDQLAEQWAKKVWPGATTLVCSEALALRMPKQTALLKLIDQIGPVYMTSANKSGQLPLSINEAKEVFSEVKTVYDFGVGSGKPSQIIDVHTAKVLRA